MGARFSEQVAGRRLAFWDRAEQRRAKPRTQVPPPPPLLRRPSCTGTVTPNGLTVAMSPSASSFAKKKSPSWRPSSSSPDTSTNSFFWLTTAKTGTPDRRILISSGL
jgi:hypothetical protein